MRYGCDGCSDVVSGGIDCDGYGGTTSIQPLGETYTWEILRLADTEVRLSAYDPDTGELLGRSSGIIESNDTHHPLTIELEAQHGTARFDNVELFGTPAVPLPAAAWSAAWSAGSVLAALAGGHLLRLRRGSA